MSSLYIKAVRTALQKLDDGCSTEDAEAVCERDVLNQIFMWKVVAYSCSILHCLSFLCGKILYARLII